MYFCVKVFLLHWDPELHTKSLLHVSMVTSNLQFPSARCQTSKRDTFKKYITQVSSE
jgi:hypothetical protein